MAQQGVDLIFREVHAVAHLKDAIGYQLLGDYPAHIAFGGLGQLGNPYADIALAGVGHQLHLHVGFQVQSTGETIQIIVTDDHAERGGSVDDISPFDLVMQGQYRPCSRTTGRLSMAYLLFQFRAG